MHKYDRFYAESCAEARDLINGWMSEKLREELEVDNNSSSSNWHEDPDAFLDRCLSKEPGEIIEPEVNCYQDDESVVVDHLLSHMQVKLNAFSLGDYEAEEKKKKSVVARDPRLTMEVRQQKVKEARARREEKVKMRLKQNMERKQNNAIAREIVKQEAREKARRDKIEEEAIQQEMAKIRKQMLDLKKKHESELTFKAHLSLDDNSNRPVSKGRKMASIDVESNVSAISLVHQDSAFQRHQENIKKFELFQRQKILRKSLHQWIKIVLAKRAAIGKAKALSDWHLLLKTWSAWRKYFFEQAALKEAQRHEESLKQMITYDHVASTKHRRRILKKCFNSWRKFVKMEQYSKELLKDQEDTKQKMNALLGMVKTKAVSVKNDLILQTVEDEDLFNENPAEPILSTVHDSTHIHKPVGSTKQSAPKHAWQVRKSDVQKLSMQQIQNMSGHKEIPSDLTKVNKIKSEPTHNSNYKGRMKATKSVIAKQRVMISQQKQIIEEQKRMIDEKYSSDKESLVTNSSVPVVSESKARILPLPKRPKSLLAMEKRAEERQKRKEELQERKRQIEKEKIERLRLEEVESRKREEEEKKRKIDEMRRIKQLEIEKEAERKAFIARMQELRRKAVDHYQKTLLKKYGLTPWCTLKRDCDSKMQVARYHFRITLCRDVVRAWSKHVREDRICKEGLAANLQRALLKRRCFHNWLKYGEAMSILEKKADIHYSKVLKSLFVRKWERFVIDEKMSYFKKEELADDHNIYRLKKRVFKTFYIYKQNVKREEIRMQRIAEMRRKVAQVLPDFEPSVSQDNF